MPKAKGGRADDALLITDENERIVELWFYAKASTATIEKQVPSNYLFLSNFAGQEDRKTLSNALDQVEKIPSSLEVCFFRRKIMLSLPVIDQIVNGMHTVILYSRLSRDDADESLAALSKSTKPSGKKDRGKREEENFNLDGTEEVLNVRLDLVDLLTNPSTRQSVSVSANSGLEYCVIEIRVGTPFILPGKLSKYRPMRIEIHSLRNLPSVAVPNDPVSVGLHFAGMKFQSHHLDIASNGKLRYRLVAFFGSKTPLNVYQDLFFRKMEVSVFSGKDCLGTGSCSLRAAVTDGEISFCETIYFLPCRTTSVFDENCLTTGAMATLHVDFFVPFPQPTHVTTDGQLARGQFLSRGIIQMPYAAKWTAIVLDSFIGMLLQLKKASKEGNVRQNELPPPEPEVQPPKGKKKEHAKSQKGPHLVLTRPPSPFSAFEAPFEVVTPPGISGFEVMDDEMRIICIEGPVSEIHMVLECVGAAADFDPQIVLLMNAELFVPQRSYLVFPPLVTPPPPRDGTVDANASAAFTNSVAPAAAVAATASASASAFNDALGSTSARNRKSASLAEASAVTLLQAKSSTNNPGESFDAAEAEAGATGGRIHRIRLRETIPNLMARQRHLIRRTLSDDCINAYSKLYAMRKCTNLRDVLLRDLFPTPAELISLERTFGVTLELADVFGRSAFIPRKTILGSSAVLVTETERRPSGVHTTATAGGVNVNALRPGDVGRIVRFDAVRVTNGRRRIPSCVAQRYPHACWMRSTDDDSEDFICAFPAESQPGGTIRYRIEAQVVRCGSMQCLYALDSSSLARSQTNSHNPTFELHLSSRQQHQRQQQQQQRQRRQHQQSYHPYSTDSMQQRVSDKREVRVTIARSRNSDSDGDADSLDSPPRDVPMQKRVHVPRIKRTTARERIIKQPLGPTDADYEMCWDLYRQLDSAVPLPHPKGPPMHF